MFKFELYVVGHIKYIMHMCWHYNIMNDIHHDRLLIIYCRESIYAVKCVCSSLVLHCQKVYVYYSFWEPQQSLLILQYLRTYISQSTHKHVHTYLCTYMYMHTYTQMYTYLITQICTHMHTQTHIHVHTYIYAWLSCILSPPGLSLQLLWQISPLMMVQGSSWY